jgi:hypothetical protein
MAAISTDVKFYNSLTATGGDINTASEIVTNVLHALIPAVSATESELGATKYKKFYVKNTNGVDSMLASVIALSAFTLGDDNFELGVSTANATTSSTETFTGMRFYGVAQTTGELNRTTKAVAIQLEDPTRATALFQVADRVTFYDSTSGAKLASATIAAITSTNLTVVEDIPIGIILNNTYVSANIAAGTLAPAAYKGIWVKQTVKAYSAEQLSNTSRLTFYFDPV